MTAFILAQLLSSASISADSAPPPFVEARSASSVITTTEAKCLNSDIVIRIAVSDRSVKASYFKGTFGEAKKSELDRWSMQLSRLRNVYLIDVTCHAKMNGVMIVGTDNGNPSAKIRVFAIWEQDGLRFVP